MEEPKFRKKHTAKEKAKQKKIVYTTKSVRIALKTKEEVKFNGRTNKKNGTL